jgi:hypothetical protein
MAAKTKLRRAPNLDSQEPSTHGPSRSFGCSVRASAREGLAVKQAREFCC